MKNKHLNLKSFIAGCALLAFSASITQCRKGPESLQVNPLKIRDKVAVLMNANAQPVTLTVDPNNSWQTNTSNINAALSNGNYSKVILAHSANGWKVGPLEMRVVGQELRIAGSGTSPGKLLAGEEPVATNDPFYSHNGVSMIRMYVDGCVINGYANGIDTTAGVATIQMTKGRYKALNNFQPDEHRMVIHSGGRSDVTIKGLYIKDAAADGIYLAASNSGTATNINITDVKIDNATRNGLSLIEGHLVNITRCKFLNTTGSRDLINADGPFSGMDIEPNKREDRIGTVIIRHSTFSGNQSHNLMMGFGKYELAGGTPMTDSVSVRLYNCSISGGQSTGVYMSGMFPSGPVGRIYFQETGISNTPKNGIYINTWAADRVKISFNRIELRNTAATSSAPIRFDHSLAFAGGEIDFQRSYIDDSNYSNHAAVFIADGTATGRLKDIVPSGTTYPALAIKLHPTLHANPNYTGIDYDPTPAATDNITLTATKVTY